MSDTEPSANDHGAPEAEKGQPLAAQGAGDANAQPKASVASQGQAADKETEQSPAAAQAGEETQPSPTKPAAAKPAPPENPIKTLLSTVPGVLTAIGGVLAAVTALVTALNGATWLQPRTVPAAAPTLTASATALAPTATAETPGATAQAIVVVATPTSPITETPSTTIEPTAEVVALLALDEDFSAPAGWEVELGDGYRTEFGQGQALIQIQVTELAVWERAPLDRPLHNLMAEVDAWRAADSADGYYGLVVREERPDYFYLFAVSSDGWYAVQRSEGASWVDLVPWTESELVLQGQAVNRLRVECHSSQMRFYVNGELIQQVEDLTHTSGEVGLLAGTFDEAPVEILFDNLIVRELAHE